MNDPRYPVGSIGGIAPNIGGVNPVVSQLFGFDPNAANTNMLRENALRAEQLKMAMDIARNYQAQSEPLRREQDALKKGGWGVWKARDAADKASERSGYHTTFADLGSRGLWGQSGLRRSRLAALHNALRDSLKKNRDEFGDVRYNALGAERNRLRSAAAQDFLSGAGNSVYAQGLVQKYFSPTSSAASASAPVGGVKSAPVGKRLSVPAVRTMQGQVVK
jgi:hypothetical protein